MGVRRALRTMAVVNQPGGIVCPGCAWPEPGPENLHRVEWCESGAKAVAEEGTAQRVDRFLLSNHSVADLRERSDFWLGQAGRLTEPIVRWPGSSHFEPISWDVAFDHIAGEIRKLGSPNEAVFYTSGRTSNEAAYVYQLMARMLGTNNLPDCSNMCHEPTSSALEETIGIGKASVSHDDFAQADLIVLAGQNPGSNHPRMLGVLETAKRSGARIIAINPLPEAGLLRFKNPQRPRGIVGSGTAIADLHLPIRLGGDQALFQLWSKWILERPSAAGFVDEEFIERYTSGCEPFRRALAAADESLLLAATGLNASAVEEGYRMVASARRLIVCWAMGITQHVHAIDTIKEITNLALLGGHIGRPGSGLCPVRGHSNVQGDRTMGIFERPPVDLLDRLERRFSSPMPRADGLDTVDAIAAFGDRRAGILMSLGGNLAHAAPDTDFTERALAKASLSVHVATKLNRTQLVAGQTAIVLPTFGRTDRDVDRYGVPRFVTVENSLGVVSASTGNLDPPSPNVRSEVAIICGLAARLADQTSVPWDDFADDYNAIRSCIEATIPDFEQFTARAQQPGGFTLPHPPRDERRFETTDGRAHFSVTRVPPVATRRGELMLQTIRSHDQYNTTIYGHHDRYRGLSGEREIILINAADLTALGLGDGDRVDIVTALPGPRRQLLGYRAMSYPTPIGTAAAYFPEANVLVPLSHHGPGAQTPASKAIPIRVSRADTGTSLNDSASVIPLFGARVIPLFG